MPRKHLFLFTVGIFLLGTFLFIPVTPVFSDEIDNLNKQIAELTEAMNQSVAATKPLESQLTNLRGQINGIKTRVVGIETDIEQKKKDINTGYKDLVKSKGLLNQTIRNYYMKSYYNSPVFALLSADSASDLTKSLAYQKAKSNQDKQVITNIALSITSLEEREKQLKNEQNKLVVLKTNLDEQSTKLDGIVQGAKAYQKEVSQKIAALSAKQQEILNARSGNFTATIGDSDQADDYNASIKGFRESAPGGYFAVFSFGAHTHRKGMSQYGARGRAQNGQNYRDILKAYYGKEPASKDTGGSIKVSGHGEIDFETTYLYGIAEMPSSWHPEALKAQAVAARTYAYRYKAEGKEICTTEACQVFNKGKSDGVPEAWKKAVDETKGQVLEDVVTYYASTHGVYIASSNIWDTTDGSGGGNFVDRSYEKVGGSPWVYKAWYTKGYSTSSDKCGRSNPWLSPEEMADIINATRFRDDRVTPVTTSCYGGNPYSHEELRAKSSGPSTVTGVSVLQGNGSTNEVIFQTNIGEIRISGSAFKEAFNLRAPGYLAVPQSGFAFFNIEKK